MYSLLIASSAETSFQIKTGYIFILLLFLQNACVKKYDFLVFVFHLKAIRFVNSVCMIFSLRKQGPLHQTFSSKPELTSAVSL